MRKVFFYSTSWLSLSTSHHDFIDRLDFYSSNLQKFDGATNMGLTFLTSRLPAENISPKSLVVRKVPRNLLLRFISIHFLLRRKREMGTLIAGNNYQDLLFCLLQRFFNSKLRIQASLHGKLSLLLNQRGARGFIKRVFLNALIPLVDSLRIVDKSEFEEVLTTFRLKQSQIVFAPVPIDLPSGLIGFQKIRTKSVALVGRLHKERGLDEWKEIALAVSRKDPNVRFMVMGGGPLEKDFVLELRDLREKINFYGFLEKSEMLEKWSDIGVLLLCAPSESYGLAAREALINSVPVVARSNSAMERLSSIAPQIVTTYTNVDQATDLILCELDRSLKESWFTDFFTNLKEEQDIFLNELYESWLT